jgi:hypothetical protein
VVEISSWFIGQLLGDSVSDAKGSNYTRGSARSRVVPTSATSTLRKQATQPMSLSILDPVMTTTIYRKTAKGQAEIETRAHRLPPRLRGALIMVDGQRTVEDLAKLVPGDAAGSLEQLLADGFIDVFAVLADRPPLVSAPVAAPEPARKPAPVQGSLDATKREAVRYLNDRLGPAAEGIAMKIERASSATDLQPLLAQAAQVLRSFGGPAASEPFVAKFIGPAQA